MTDETTRQWRLASRPTGEPSDENFALTTVERPSPEEGEVLFRTLYLSVDPYMRGRMRDAESYAEPWAVGEPMQAGVVGEVIESEHDEFEAGDVVTGNALWAEHAVVDGAEIRPVNPDLAPVSTALGVLGMTGVTGFFGMTDVAEPASGETAVVSAAAGAVGSVAGQVASLRGARVVGIAGSERKCTWLTDELGFDAAVNYKQTEDMAAALSDACPDGVDVYFDNVGGPITDAVFQLLNVNARVAVCGQISLYNSTEQPTGPRKLGTLIEKRARVEGFLVGDYADRWGEALEQLGGFIGDGDLAYSESVVDGFENAPDAFLGLFEGENIGKQLVKVNDRQHN